MAHIIRQEPNFKQSTVWEHVADHRRLNDGGLTANAHLKHRWSQRHKVNPRENLHMTISYRGGSEPLYLVKARGSMALFAAHDYIHDVVSEVTKGEEWYWEERS
uniref:Uncharacterized protein n=1 Tax=uncultured prokaryote TaxID=198431 RepID=A0A0H5Q8J2_9ZZZZ|nr:hypothetical protein [uncultured prokaryote]